jgi:hypothetical protein
MNIIEVSSRNKYKILNHINEFCGGETKGKKGISGFKYIQGLDIDFQSTGILDPHSINLEIFNNGLGIYFRNIHLNYIILLSSNEITSLAITKGTDLINNSKYSIFYLLMKLNIPYHLSKYFLLEKDITKMNKSIVKISLQENKEIILSNSERKIRILKEILEKSNLNKSLNIHYSIKSYAK